MINRRNLLVAAAAVICTVGTAGASDWKSQYPELTFAVVPAENASGVSDRFAPFVEYLSKELGVPVKLRVANDYAAVIEGQRAGNIQIAYYGPASYSTAYLTGVKTEPFVTTRNNDGAIGYTEARERETVVAGGGNKWMAVRFGLLPQVLPVIASQILYFFESNTRSATIIGIVGAGGIGLQLSEQIRTYDFDQVSFIILLILAAVAAMDWISGKLRFAIIGRTQPLT